MTPERIPVEQIECSRRRRRHHRSEPEFQLSLIANDAAGIPVTSGTQYWVVVKTNDTKHPTFFGAWAFNSTDMRGHTIASWCNSTGGQCGSNNGKWVLFTGALQPAYAVKGS
jgi:hemolysin-activating ACP:hemolysin acyltransferase